MPNQPVLVVDICLLFEGVFFLFFSAVRHDTTRHDTLDEGRTKGAGCVLSLEKRKGSRDWKKGKSRSVVHRYLVSAKAQTIVMGINSSCGLPI